MEVVLMSIEREGVKWHESASTHLKAQLKPGWYLQATISC